MLTKKENNKVSPKPGGGGGDDDDECIEWEYDIDPELRKIGEEGQTCWMGLSISNSS